ncbi:MAG: hypothetical protein GY821_01750 [Gammaproteobacteria bacterium]|nr:hypothetical protein [Gammaproteobacteria bacterium]
MKSLVPWPFRQTGRLKICAYCGLRASAFGFPWPAAAECNLYFYSQYTETKGSTRVAPHDFGIFTLPLNPLIPLMPTGRIEHPTY